MATRAVIDSTMFFYALSLFFYFMDVLESKRIFNRLAVVLLFMVFIGETSLLIARFIQLQSAPVYSRFDNLLLISWLILVVALVVDTFYRVGLFIFFANLVAFSFVIFASFGPFSPGIIPHGRPDLLIFHISLALVSYVFFSVAFVFSVMYLVQYHLLRKKSFNHWFLRLPGLEHSSRTARWCNRVGFTLLLISSLLGFLWGKIVLNLWIWDSPTPMATLVLLLFYALTFWLEIRRSLPLHVLHRLYVVCFMVLLINFLLIGRFGGYH
ncbi:cytochrome c biogenesis protein CcsA [Alicyclobacillus tolerans]|uniref:HemX protein n=2 Tax=Alicyclobacillus tolerans TaxID=90970 RepID=A0ABT9LX02_9BACL|nr:MULTISPECIES: cytochrome c biogenesis protein CcsA [Alicyclobacillus]MDP9728798.1 HemX protein [Alicyclobacillus tengchongensis]QRF23197.1 cytochrome C assembly protein [Alicyclobacillus sp. TC]SHK71336.1 HemX family protein [Alicyclobacillus montanus]